MRLRITPQAVVSDLLAGVSAAFGIAAAEIVHFPTPIAVSALRDSRRRLPAAAQPIVPRVSES